MVDILPERHVLQADVLAVAVKTVSILDTYERRYFFLLAGHGISFSSPLHLIQELVSGEEGGLAPEAVTVVLEELLSEVLLDGTASPT